MESGLNAASRRNKVSYIIANVRVTLSEQPFKNLVFLKDSFIAAHYTAKFVENYFLPTQSS